MHKKYLISESPNMMGTVRISGAKNVATKAVIAACLTEESVTINNVPNISDIDSLLEVIESIGGNVERHDQSVTITVREIKNNTITLEEGAKVRTASMFLSPLLLRIGQAIVPNPQGCRIGARPIERHIEGLEMMGAKIEYKSEDGYYHASAENGLTGTTYRFEKNTHTGTETLIMAAVLARGETVIENAAQEHEIDDLISLLNAMGAKVERVEPRKIVINGVEKLHGTTYEIVSDGNETVTFAVLSCLTGGKIYLENANMEAIEIFIKELRNSGGDYEEENGRVRFFIKEDLKSTQITTAIEPGFKTDWQGPWAILMTQAKGESVIHETIYENRFGYVSELKKMGAKIEFFEPQIQNPTELYNFNYDPQSSYKQAIKINGPQKLHNAVVSISDLRAGATLVMAALIAKGESVIYGVEHIERGYERFAERLKSLGANIKEVIE